MQEYFCCFGKIRIKLILKTFIIFQVAQDNLGEKFKNINIADGDFEGTILGFRDILCYQSCSNELCLGSIRGLKAGENCSKCFSKISTVHHDFRCLVLIDLGESQDMELLCFRRKLALDDVEINFENSDDIEEQISTIFVGSKVRGTYIRRVDTKTNVISFIIETLEMD